MTQKAKAFSFASVTVAYNGAEVLTRHLDALKGQTRRLDEIIVVDNASSDNTAKLLANYSDVTILSFSENLGVGGGYAEGLKYAALQKKYDWIWLFDQDSVPATDALERLLEAMDEAGEAVEDIAILAPICRHSAATTTYPGLLWKGGRMIEMQADSARPITWVDLVISSGSLMKRQAIESAGLPRADFFMDFVDYEHCLRLRHLGFRIGVVRDSHLEHVLGEPKRFSYLGHTTRWTDHAPWRVYYMTRNEVFTIWHCHPSWKSKWFVGYRSIRYAVSVLIFGKNKTACLGMILRGWMDGLTGRLGDRYRTEMPRESLMAGVRK
jgi:GT2 family glycosyltransferase